MPLQRQLDQPAHQLAVAHACRLPQLRIHADARKARQRVDLVDQHLPLIRQKHIHPRQPGTAQGFKRFDSQRTNALAGFNADIRRHHHLGRLVIDVFAVVGVETVPYHDLAATTGDGILVAQHGAFDFPAFDRRLHQHLFIKPEGQFYGGMIFSLAAHLAHTHGRTLVRRFHEHRHSEFLPGLFEGGSRRRATVEGNERRHGNPGIAQQAFADVLVHAHGRAQHVGADKRQVGHAQQALQAAVFAEGAVDDREDHIDMFQRGLAGGFHQLLAGLARHHGQFTIGLIEGDQRRIFFVEQKARGVVEVPVAGLVNADQDRLKARTVQCIDDVARRLQRHFVLGRTATKNNPYPQLAHDRPHV